MAARTLPDPALSLRRLLEPFLSNPGLASHRSEPLGVAETVGSNGLDRTTSYKLAAFLQDCCLRFSLLCYGVCHSVGLPPFGLFLRLLRGAADGATEVS